jgi:hypothetical protein
LPRTARRAVRAAWAVMHPASVHAAAAPAVMAHSAAAATAPHLGDHAVIHVRCEVGRSENLDRFRLRQTEAK